MKKANIALIGFQACGKTTLGQHIAEKMQRLFIDTDRLIEQHHPTLTVSAIFRNHGESYFRQLEGQVLKQLEVVENHIIAVGGGTLIQAKNPHSLKQHSYCIYLRTDPLILKNRIWNRLTLPAYLDVQDPHTSFDQIYSQRALLYEEYADKIIDMKNLLVDQAVQLVMKKIESDYLFS